MLNRLVLTIFLASSQAWATDATQPERTAIELWEADRSMVFDAREVDLSQFIWVARPIIVFSDSPANPAFVQQMEFLRSRLEELEQRDVVVITDTDPGDPSDLRKEFRPRGFMLTIFGKDGAIKLRKPFPWNVREISRAIDKMPIRRQEISDRNSNN